MAKRLALGFGHRLADDLAQGIAERRAHGKGDDQDRQHDEHGLGEPARDEAEPAAIAFMEGSCGPPLPDWERRDHLGRARA